MLFTAKYQFLSNYATSREIIALKYNGLNTLFPLEFAPLIFAHPQISRPFNFLASLFYCKFTVFSFHAWLKGEILSIAVATKCYKPYTQ